MDCRDGQRIGQRDGQVKGWKDVVLLYLFYFLEKQNFRIFVKSQFPRKSKFSHFRGQFSRKTRMIFVRIFAKIYFRPNSSRKYDCPRCMWMLLVACPFMYMPHVHTCPCFMSLLHVQAACSFCLSCRLSVLHVLDARTCCMSVPLVYSLSLLHVLIACPCCITN